MLKCVCIHLQFIYIKACVHSHTYYMYAVQTCLMHETYHCYVASNAVYMQMAMSYPLVEDLNLLVSDFCLTL